jgi:hypothetical protein
LVHLDEVHKGEMRNVTIFLLENQKGRDHSEDKGVDGNIILEWILGKLGGKVWTGCIWIRLETNVGIL